MAVTPNIGLPLQENWTTDAVIDWAKVINDGASNTNAFQKIDDFAGDVTESLSGKQAKATTMTITIAVADWAGGTTCTKTATGVTASNIVFCDSSNASVECTAQGSGTLTFTAESTPTASVTVKVVVLP